MEEKPQSRPQTRARAPSGRPGSKFAPPKRNPRDSASTAGYCLSDPGERRPLRAPSTIRDAVASEATSMGVIKLSSEIKPTLENNPIAVNKPRQAPSCRDRSRALLPMFSPARRPSTPPLSQFDYSTARTCSPLTRMPHFYKLECHTADQALFEKIPIFGHTGGRIARKEMHRFSGVAAAAAVPY